MEETTYYWIVPTFGGIPWTNITTNQTNPLLPSNNNFELNQAYQEGKTTRIPNRVLKPPNMTEAIRVAREKGELKWLTQINLGMGMAPL